MSGKKGMRRYSQSMKKEIIAAYQSGESIKGLSRE
jgi:transposase-like protein